MVEARSIWPNSSAYSSAEASGTSWRMLDSKSLSVSLRVLHIEATDQRRGAEIITSDLVRALDGMGVEQRVAVLRGAQPLALRFDAPVSLPGWADGARCSYPFANLARHRASIIEAGVAGVPVAAYAVAGVEEVVTDGTTGLLARPGDQGGLTRRVVDLLADGARRRAIGEAAQERCGARFDIRSVTPRYRSVYEEVAAS
jgi:glycosyltransferase involved in cell wall biosynthesis